MRLLNYLVHNLPDDAPPQHAAQDLLRRQLVPVPAVQVPAVQVGTLVSASVAVCSTKAIVTVTAGLNLPAVTLLGKRQVLDLPLVCTTTVTVSQSTITSINSVTSTYSGPVSSASPTPVRQCLLSLSLCSKLCSGYSWGAMRSAESYMEGINPRHHVSNLWATPVMLYYTSSVFI
jgi:hypothetical protein